MAMHCHGYPILTTSRTNSKATVRLPVKDFLPLIPTMLHAPVKSSRYYASRSDSLVIHSDSSRKQGDNVNDCFQKLRQLIINIGETTVKGDTSSQQANKVEKLCVLLKHGLSDERFC